MGQAVMIVEKPKTEDVKIIPIEHATAVSQWLGEV